MAQAPASEYSPRQKVGGVLFAGLGPFLYGAAGGTVLSFVFIFFGFSQLDPIMSLGVPVSFGLLVAVVYLYMNKFR